MASAQRVRHSPELVSTKDLLWAGLGAQRQRAQQWLHPVEEADQGRAAWLLISTAVIGDAC